MAQLHVHVLPHGQEPARVRPDVQGGQGEEVEAGGGGGGGGQGGGCRRGPPAAFSEAPPIPGICSYNPLFSPSFSQFSPFY